MNKDIERLLYIYKRGLSILSKVTEKEVKEHLDCSYEEYVQGVAKKHLQIGKEIEELGKLESDKEIDIDKLLKDFEE